MEMKITWSTLAKQQLKDDFRTKAQAPLADQNSGRDIASPATSSLKSVGHRCVKNQKFLAYFRYFPYICSV